LNINRTAYRYEPVRLQDEDSIRADIIYKACNFGRVGYRMVTNMMKNEGIRINHKRVERVWREEGLKLPRKQIKRRRLWLSDGSCIRLRAEHENHVWSYDFVEDKTMNGKKIRFLNIIEWNLFWALVLSKTFPPPQNYLLVKLNQPKLKLFLILNATE
jgi:hypothetical protein